MWKNRPQLTVLYGACTFLVTDTHWAYVILTGFPLQEWLCECASVLPTFPVLFIYDIDEFWPSKGEALAGECSWNVWNTLVSPNTDIITCSVCDCGLSWSKNDCFIKNITCFPGRVLWKVSSMKTSLCVSRHMIAILIPSCNIWAEIYYKLLWAVRNEGVVSNELYLSGRLPCSCLWLLLRSCWTRIPHMLGTCLISLLHCAESLTVTHLNIQTVPIMFIFYPVLPVH